MLLVHGTAKGIAGINRPIIPYIPDLSNPGMLLLLNKLGIYYLHWDWIHLPCHSQ